MAWALARQSTKDVVDKLQHSMHGARAKLEAAIKV